MYHKSVTAMLNTHRYSSDIAVFDC